MFSSEESFSDEEESVQQGRERGGQEKSLFPYHQPRPKHTPGYSYKKLSELEPGLQKVNMFGVVTDFKPPFQTKGRDFCCIVNIRDESLNEWQSFKCTFFHANQERLPKVSKVGEIVCFHRINVKMFPAGIQGIGQNFSSSLTFSGKLGSKVKPVTGSVSYTFTAEDRKRVKQLRVWSARQAKNANPFVRALKDVTTNVASSDLVCQVLAISLREPSLEPRIAVLHVWDGTQTRHRRLALDLSTYSTTHVADLELLEILRDFSESVVVYGRDLVESVSRVHPGQFLCLQNVQARLHTRQCNSFKDVFDAVELRLQPVHTTPRGRDTKVRVLQDDSIEVYELKSRLKKFRQAPGFRFRPLPPDIVPSPITETQHSKDQAPVPLSAVIRTEDAAVKFLCVVKVLGIEPCSVEEMVQLRCPLCKTKKPVGPKTARYPTCGNQKCPGERKRRKKKAAKLEPMYFFKLKLADETGHLEVYASGAQAARFLSEFPPLVYYHHPQQRMALLELLYSLTGENDPFDSDSVRFPRPWLAVCLVSMATSITSGSLCEDPDVTYHLFDTVLKSNI